MSELNPADAAPEAAPEGGLDLLRFAPGLVRIAAASGWRLANWVFTTSFTTTNQLLRAISRGESPNEVITEALSTLRAIGRQAIGSEPLPAPGEAVPVASGRNSDELRRLGAELLARSADVWAVEEIHPAYERILGEMAPDEARILRFLALNGPQPSLDVRTGRPFSVGSELVAGGLSMIGLHAGVRQLERTNAYQNNLFRLGLIWFSREELDPGRYQVVEVQPEVADALKRAGRAPRTVRRSILLTPFGEDFCRTCIPLDSPHVGNGHHANGSNGSNGSTPH